MVWWALQSKSIQFAAFFAIFFLLLANISFAMALDVTGSVLTAQGKYTNSIFPDSGNFELGEEVHLSDEAIPPVTVNYQLGVQAQHDVPFDDVTIDYDVEVTVTKRSVEPQPADIIWILDRSLSMSDDIQAVQDDARQFLEELENGNIPYRLGVVGFMGDSWPIEHDGFSASFGDGSGTFTTDSAEWLEMLEFVQTHLTHYIESGLSAADASLRYYDFNPDAKTFFVLLTDENSDDYDGDYSSCFPFSNPNKLDETVALMMVNSVTIYTLALPKPGSPPGNCYEYSSGPEYYDAESSIAAQTGGEWYDISRSYPDLLEHMGQHLSTTYGSETETTYTLDMPIATISTGDTFTNPYMSPEQVQNYVIAQTGIADLYTNPLYSVEHRIVVNSAQFTSGGDAPLIYAGGFFDGDTTYIDSASPRVAHSYVAFYMVQTVSGIVSESYVVDDTVTISSPHTTYISSQTVKELIEDEIPTTIPDIYGDSSYTVLGYLVRPISVTFADGSDASAFINWGLDNDGAVVQPGDADAKDANILLDYTPDPTKYAYIKSNDGAFINLRLNLYVEDDATGTQQGDARSFPLTLARGELLELADYWNGYLWQSAGFDEDVYRASVDVQDADGTYLGQTIQNNFELFVDQATIDCGARPEEQGMGLPITGYISPPVGLSIEDASMKITDRSSGEITTIPMSSVGAGAQFFAEYVAWNAGLYDYEISFTNTDGTSTFSGSCSGTVEYYIDVDLTIETEQSYYGLGDVVRLTDERRINYVDYCYETCSSWNVVEQCVQNCDDGSGGSCSNTYQPFGGTGTQLN